MNRNLLIAAAGAALLALGGYFLLARTTAPAPSEQPHAAKSPAPQASEALVAVHLPAQLTETARLGKQHFDTNCQICHGANAQGRDGFGPPLIHKIYEPSHHGDMSFYRAAALGVRAHHWRFGNMPAVEGVTQEQVSAIIAYIRELQRANGIF
ncbi:MAG: cytochrome c [Neomegalonema sp.]|nr:cytochrome c [Neomegalonema sp.]